MGKLICVSSFSFSLPFVLRLSVVVMLNFVNFPSVFAQKSAEKDSLLKLLEILPEDTNKVNILNQLCFLSAKSDPKNSLKYGKRSKVLALKLSFKPGLIEANSNLGRTYRFSGEYDQAIMHKEEALKEAQKIQDSSRIAKGLRQMGILHRLKGDFPAALKYYFSALKTYENIKDKLREGHTLSSIGSLYYYQKKFQQSLRFHEKALEIHKSLEDIKNTAIDYNNLGNVYSEF